MAMGDCCQNQKQPLPRHKVSSQIQAALLDWLGPQHTD
uniref:EMB2730 (EMBRYO DEFECTIVE 2730) n=1 Tax=Arundo donax TaxID=35708 RepID=A0A0A9S3E3_ARUDO